MLTLCDVSKSFGGRTLFAEVSLQVNRADRVGIVGPNGAGKSTLIALILGRQSPDAGKIMVDRRAAIGYLPQEIEPAGAETVLELATAITPETVERRRGLTAGADTESGGADYPAAPARDEELGGYLLEPRAKQILAGLGFRESDFARPARELSGGWVMRARLAQLLVQAPDLLLLDEPTNHLDLDALLWFQDYLRNYPGAILLISHDREFLNQLVGSIVEIRQGRLLRFSGNYEDYLGQRDIQAQQLEAAYRNQQREIARLMQFVDRFRAKNTKASQAQSKLKQIERLDKIEAPPAEAPRFEFEFPQAIRSGLKVITLRGVALAYGPAVVYRHLDFAAERGQRIVLVGPNGAGKSTLLKILAGVLPVQAGARELGYNVKAGYYSQYRLETLHPERTVLEEGLDTPQRITELFVRTVLGSFGFVGDDVFKPVAVLSGGEKSRLALVRLLLDPPNLLLMDEPTTHLDMAGVEALILALEQFTGTLLFISHDVFFIRALATKVVRVCSGVLCHYAGDYQYYLDKTASAIQLQAIKDAAASVPDQRLVDDRPSARLRDQKRRAAEQRQARSRARRAQQHIVHEFEKEIAGLEKRLAELTAELADPATYQKNGRVVIIRREMGEIQGRLPRLNADWEAAATALLEIDADIGDGAA